MLNKIINIDESFNNDTYYEDLRMPFTQAKQGATLKPDFDYTNVGLLFPQNDATEIAYFIAQLPGSREEYIK